MTGCQIQERFPIVPTKDKDGREICKVLDERGHSIFWGSRRECGWHRKLLLRLYLGEKGAAA